MLKVLPITSSSEAQFYGIKSGNFFSGDAWCQCFDDRLKRFVIADEKNNVVGRFVAFEGGKARLRTLITPPFAPHIGLSITDLKNNPSKANTFRKQVMDAMADFLKASDYVFYKLDFAPEWNDMQPLIWKNINAQVRYTYRIDLRRSEAEISENLDPNKRNKISKATREGMTVHHEPDVDKGLALITENLRDKPVKLHADILRKILTLASQQGNGTWSTVLKDGQTVAINICITANNICYNLLSAIDRSAGHNHGGTFCLFNSILKARENKLLVFDFEGSGVPEIEEFFRSFGGEITPYFSIRGGKWPWPMIMKWRQEKRLT